MINLRYHIVSITAVFLALAVGVAMGSTFIEGATVERLESRLDDLSERVRRTDGENAELRALVDVLEQRQEQLGEASARLVAGHLQGVPVVVLATRGIDSDSFEAARQAVIDAGADYQGTLWVADRLRLEDEAVTEELAAIIGSPSTDPGRVRRSLATNLADRLVEAAAPAPIDIEAQAAEGTPVQETPPAEPTQPASTLVEDLRAGGFLEYDPPPGQPSERPALPAAGARYLVVSGAAPEVDNQLFLLPVLRAMASAGAVPLVAAEASVGEEAEAARTSFVGPLRADDTLDDRLSTVDDLESSYGVLAAVLALEDLGAGRTGHYGLGDGDDDLPLLPGTSP